MPPRPLLSALGLAVLAGNAWAGDPVPEVQRPPAAPQAVGVLHTLRTIPEACARIEGRFSGDPAQPYQYGVVRTSAACQPRAALVDAGKAKPRTAKGWVFNDLIRVPSAACPQQQAVLRIWRHPADATPPKLDAQGRSRIYLADSVSKAKAGKLPPIPLYTATLAVEGTPCR
ncbi:MAG TPA: hypothetical protein VLM17_06415 [Xanthomonadaceae bacterium]|nr:hypothetical protein [Xanthomonadaceae bacterium]